MEAARGSIGLSEDDGRSDPLVSAVSGLDTSAVSGLDTSAVSGLDTSAVSGLDKSSAGVAGVTLLDAGVASRVNRPVVETEEEHDRAASTKRASRSSSASSAA